MAIIRPGLVKLLRWLLFLPASLVVYLVGLTLAFLSLRYFPDDWIHVVFLSSPVLATFLALFVAMQILPSSRW